MAIAEAHYFEQHSDERGSLIAVEFADVPFEVKRVFVVHGREGGADRGDHFVVGRQLIVVQSGKVSISLGPNAARVGESHELIRPGEALLVEDGAFIRYRLIDSASSILVLCERAYEPREQ